MALLRFIRDNRAEIDEFIGDACWVPNDFVRVWYLQHDPAMQAWARTKGLRQCDL